MEFYHVLNRGVDKRKIFMDDKDHFRFIHDLFEFNDVNPSDHAGYYSRKLKTQFADVDVGRQQIGKKKDRTPRQLLVKIHCFAMMSNHYHLLLSPVVENGISLFMKKLNGGYAKYFNEKYERSGALFQGKYKSVHIDNDRHFLFIPYYIHFNPLDLKYPEWRNRDIKDLNGAIEYLKDYRWSSHLDYLGIKNFPSVTQRETLLNNFGSIKEYTDALKGELKNFSQEGFEDIAIE